MATAIMWRKSGEKKEVSVNTRTEAERAAEEFGADRVSLWGEVWLKISGEWVIL